MSDVFRILLGTSVSGGIAALMVIIARLIIGRRPGPVLRILFVLLIIRLAIPVSVQSPLSVLNLLGTPVRAEQILDIPVYIPTEAKDFIIDTAQAKEPQPTGSDMQKNNNPDDDTYINRTNNAAVMSVMDICVFTWLCGIAIFSVILIFGNVRFNKYLRRNREYNAPGFDELLSACKNELGIRRKVKTVRASAISTAAVYGVFRPKLLVSPSFEGLSLAEKRHVLLHELSHIKHRDNMVCFLASVLSIMHWFNPLVWVAFTLMRKDIEVMCDTQALKKIGDRHGYALTLLNLASASPAVKPKFVSALFVSTDAIKRRINMIVKNKKSSVLITILGIILVFAIAICGCTGAVQPSQEQQPAAKTPSESQQNTTESPDSNVFTLKDGSVSVTIPEGWEAKDISFDECSMGMIGNKQDKNYIDIYSTSIIGWDTTPDSEMNTITTSGFMYGETDGDKEQTETVIPSVVAATQLTVDGVDGKLFELSATVKFNGAELHGYMAVFVGNEKSYKISYISVPEDFETYKELVKSVISSAKFN